MTVHTFDLEGIFAYTRGNKEKTWSAEATIDLSKLNTEIVERLVRHAVGQKISDSCSQAKNATEASASMEKAIAALLAGEWSSRVAGEGVSEETAVTRSVTREAYKAKTGGKGTPDWEAFTGLSDADQATKLDALFAKNEKALRPAVDAELARRAAKRAEKAALKGLDFTL